MVISIIVKSTQIYNVKMTSSKNITKSKVQKQVAKYGFGRTFHDLKYSKHGFFFLYSLNS
jgi:signal transduction histidine kinase